MPRKGRKAAKLWSLHPKLHDDVAQLLNEEGLQLDFFDADDEETNIEERDTNVMGRFICRNSGCHSSVELAYGILVAVSPSDSEDSTKWYKIIFRSQPLYIVVDSVKVELWIHSAAIERFPPSLREELDIPGRIQGEGPTVVRNIDLETFALYCEYVYTGNYSVSETLFVSRNNSQTSPKLKEGNAQGFEGPFAVVVPKLPMESRTLLHTLLIHVRIYIYSAKHKWEPLKLLSFQKFQNALERAHLTATSIDELTPMFRFISEQKSGAANNLARYITDYLTAKIRPLQGNSSLWNFAEWTQSKERSFTS
ncbi:hypothetical protein KXW39_007055 [Aspergillus fumigatus]|nr:hypothetical protein KXX17_001174 [Aspergillus fumigatus]KAH2377276.1 hypothetical protein KXV62_000577 [Aspergillus fumigatus]KAH3305503.1 hypothetical protein KXV87_000250 [Aspergillus fumigatus]KAH3428269.1 hypothetical protein KXW39_007055 [Aspergillus fumigatus]